MENLLKIMRRLRGPNGCPWDREQTHKSLKKNLIEEAYEVIDAIDSEDDRALCEELGDLLLQVAFHTVIAQEEHRFGYEQVEKGICDKLVSRHTHIFGDDTAFDADEVLKLWKANKKKEKGQKTVTQAMEDIPSSYPALLESYKVQGKAADVGFDWTTAPEAFVKLEEELAEFKEAVVAEDMTAMEDEAGDLLFSMVNVCRLLKVDPETALHKTVQKFKRRFSTMEEQCIKENRDTGKMSLAEWDQLWDMAKAAERKNNEIG